MSQQICLFPTSGVSHAITGGFLLLTAVGMEWRWFSPSLKPDLWDSPPSHPGNSGPVLPCSVKTSARASGSGLCEFFFVGIGNSILDGRYVLISTFKFILLPITTVLVRCPCQIRDEVPSERGRETEEGFGELAGPHATVTASPSGDVRADMPRWINGLSVLQGPTPALPAQQQRARETGMKEHIP